MIKNGGYDGQGVSGEVENPEPSEAEKLKSDIKSIEQRFIEVAVQQSGSRIEDRAADLVADIHHFLAVALDNPDANSEQKLINSLQKMGKEKAEKALQRVEDILNSITYNIDRHSADTDQDVLEPYALKVIDQRVEATLNNLREKLS